MTKTSLLAVASCMACLAMGTGTVEAAEQLNSVGFGFYSTQVTYADYYASDDFSGGAVFYTRGLSRNIAFRGGLFSTDHDTYSSVDASGMDIQLLFGNNFTSNGFKIYGGPGYFSEEWRGPGGSLAFNGLQLTIGIGYNWDQFALDWWGTARSSSDYSDAYSGSTTASSGGLMASYRF